MLGENNYCSYRASEEVCLPISGFKNAERAKASFESVFSESDALSADLIHLISETYRLFRAGHHVDLSDIKVVLEQLVDSIRKNPYPSLYLCGVKNKEKYLVEHAFRTCAYSINLGLAVGLDDELVELALSAVLSDVGKIMIPDVILSKEGALSSAEYAVIRVHPMEGRKILQNHSDAPESVFDVVMSHHEQVNGKGYPLGLKDEEISTFSRIVAIADAYDAMTSERSYAAARSVEDAKGILWEQRGQQFDQTYVESFLSLLGDVQARELIQLKNGSEAVLLEPLFKQSSKVLVMRDLHTTPAIALVDLNDLLIDTSYIALDQNSANTSVFSKADASLRAY